ncbi:MAG: TIGR04282 family arsenosugar biosynthesis glycosyltransferase [Caldimonas sp.]
MVIVFAKAPVAGFAKTRLAAALGDDGAALLAQRLLAAAVAQALDSAVGPVELCCAPDRDHPAFAALGRGAALTEQGAGDLGARMARAFERALVQHGRAILIGTDVPGLDASYLRAAVACFEHCDCVLGPALDGGYTLIGLKRPAPELFEGIAWSTAQVLDQTRARLRRLGRAWTELDALADIDEPADLRHLPATWRTDFGMEPTCSR